MHGPHTWHIATLNTQYNSVMRKWPFKYATLELETGGMAVDHEGLIRNCALALT